MLIEIYSKKYEVYGSVLEKENEYHLRFAYHGKNFEKKICKVTESSTVFISEAALFEMEGIIREKIVEEYLCSMK